MKARCGNGACDSSAECVSELDCWPLLLVKDQFPSRMSKETLVEPNRSTRAHQNSKGMAWAQGSPAVVGKGYENYLYTLVETES